MPRLTEAMQLALCRKQIRQWKGVKGITISVLSRTTGLSIRRVEVLTRKHHLRVRRNARETTEELSNEYLDTIEEMRAASEMDCSNFKAVMVHTLKKFLRQRERAPHHGQC